MCTCIHFLSFLSIIIYTLLLAKELPLLSTGIYTVTRLTHSYSYHSSANIAGITSTLTVTIHHQWRGEGSGNWRRGELFPSLLLYFQILQKWRYKTYLNKMIVTKILVFLNQPSIYSIYTCIYLTIIAAPQQQLYTLLEFWKIYRCNYIYIV